MANMGFRTWHPGKLVMFWLMCLGGSAVSFLFANSVDVDWWVLAAAFLGSGIALAIAPWVVTWNWFDAREKSGQFTLDDGKPEPPDKVDAD